MTAPRHKRRNPPKGWATGLRLVLACVCLAAFTACPGHDPLRWGRVSCSKNTSNTTLVLDEPRFIAKGPDVGLNETTLYVSDYAGNKIVAISEATNVMTQVFDGGCPDSCILNGPTGLAVAPVAFSNELSSHPEDFQLYIADSRNDRIVVLDATGVIRRTWGNRGSSEGEFDGPLGIALSADGMVYVVDSGNCRIQVFDTTGLFLASWGGEGANPGQLRAPVDVAVGYNADLSTRFVAVSDPGNQRVQLFSPSGTPIGSIGLSGSIAGISIVNFGNRISLEVVDRLRRQIHHFVWEGGINWGNSLAASEDPYDVVQSFGRHVVDRATGEICLYDFR